jgi:uncharacterized membrane protein YhaH (DUF805 family)
MNFTDAVRACLIKFADFNGRASLPEYWWFVLFGFLGALVLNFVSGSLANIFSLITFIPTVAVTARRLHDINKSGWLQLVWIIGSIIGIVMIIFGFASLLIPSMGGGSSMMIGALGALISLGSLVFMVISLIKSGDVGENKYGQAPIESMNLPAKL